MKRWLPMLGVVLILLGVAGMLAVPLLSATFPDTFSGARSLGERIYLTGIGESGPIPRRGAFVHHHLSSAGCAGCHGADGAGGAVFVRFRRTVEAPEVTYRALTSAHKENGEREPGWTDAQIEQAIRRGEKPNGERLDRIMPRWDVSDEEMRALLVHLKELDK